jgi:predicted DNA repair protein MutK
VARRPLPSVLTDMAGGLVALLDDVAALARLAAASMDDVAAAAGRAGVKTAGVVIDDAAVTPSYVVGLPPERELPIIGKIALGSLRNKLLFILPAALLLSAFAPVLLTPILMLGGLYLSFEGAEKIIESLQGEKAVEEVARITDPAQLESRQVGSAIRTDFILSAEIMVIALNQVSASPIATQAFVLALVGVAVTIGVYGVVGLIVKMDDVGLHLAAKGGATASVGRALVHAMPVLLRALAIIGTAAMLWVGGGILIHGLAVFGFSAPEEWIHAAAHAMGSGVGVVEWAVTAVGSAIVGTLAGALIAGVLHLKPGAKH